MRKQTKFDLCNHINLNWGIQSIYYKNTHLWITMMVTDNSNVNVTILNVQSFNITDKGYISPLVYANLKRKEYNTNDFKNLVEFERSIGLKGIKNEVRKFLQKIQKEKPLEVNLITQKGKTSENIH